MTARPPACGRSLPWVAATCLWLLLGAACGSPEFGDVQSEGGLVRGSRLARVTSLADNGDGSLRAALATCGPCVVLFDVSGVIRLESDLTISGGPVTVAGETAPSPGVILYGGTLRIRASDVVVSHLAIYPGSTTDPERAKSRDGISVYGSVSKQQTIGRIVLRNVSVGWGVDENIGLQGLVDGIRIERALISHPLRHGGHPKGSHSMNLLLGSSVGRVVVLGSVLAGADQRSPRLTTGNRVTFVNNLVVAPGTAASHVEPSSEVSGSGAIDMIGNAFVAAPFTNCRRLAIHIDDAFLAPSASTPVYLADNHVDNGRKPGCLRLPPVDLPGLASAPLTRVAGWPLTRGRDVEAAVLPFAGSHPIARNPIDARLVAEICSGTVGLLDDERGRGGLAESRERRAVAAVPIRTATLRTAHDVGAVRQWLCQHHQRVTGLSICP